MSATQGDVMVGNVKSLVNRLSRDFSASKPPLSVQESRKIINLKPSPPLQHVITTFAYSAAQDDELSLELGDVIEVLEEVEDGWSRGRQLRTNIIGMFPTNFVKPNVFSSNSLREEEKVVMRPATNGDQPEANRRTPSVIGGMSVVAGKVQVEAREEPKFKEMARVKFEYEPQHSDELRLGEIGQLITIIRKDCGDVGWFEGEINGRRGLFPDNFVELIQVPFNTQSGVVYHPTSQNLKAVTKPPMVNPVGMVPPAVPAKPLKQKLSESPTSINGSAASNSSASPITNPPSVVTSHIKHQSSAFVAARDRISKDLIVGQPGQLSSKLTKSVVVSSGTESIVSSRPLSNVEMEDALDSVTSPLSHVTKTRARPPGKRPANLLLLKKKESTDKHENLCKSISVDMLDRNLSVSIPPTLPSSASTHSTGRESVPSTLVSSSNCPALKVVPMRPPPAEIKMEEKKECIPTVKPLANSCAHQTTSSLSSNIDTDWVSRIEYNELLARLESMEARIDQLEKR